MSLCYIYIHIYKVYNICVCTVRKAFNYMTTYCFFHRVLALFGEQDRPASHVGHLTVKKAVPYTTLPC